MLSTHASYLRDVFLNPQGSVELVAQRLKGIQYDTIVGCGVSGTILLFPLQARLGKHVAVIRKPNDGTHSMQNIEGTIGSRYVIVDDQVSSGATVRYIKEQIANQFVAHGKGKPRFVGVCSFLPDSVIADSSADIRPWLSAEQFRNRY